MARSKVGKRKGPKELDKEDRRGTEKWLKGILYLCPTYENKFMIPK
jgi:hypothetical protein